MHSAWRHRSNESDWTEPPYRLKNAFIVSNTKKRLQLNNFLWSRNPIMLIWLCDFSHVRKRDWLQSFISEGWGWNLTILSPLFPSWWTHYKHTGLKTFSLYTVLQAESLVAAEDVLKLLSPLVNCEVLLQFWFTLKESQGMITQRISEL